MAEREEVRKATTKDDGPNYKSRKNTARPTQAEIDAGVPGTETFRDQREDDGPNDMFKGEQVGRGVEEP